MSNSASSPRSVLDEHIIDSLNTLRDHAKILVGDNHPLSENIRKAVVKLEEDLESDAWGRSEQAEINGWY